MKNENFRINCPVPIDKIRNKLIRASFSTDGGTTINSGIGKIMVSVNSEEMSKIWIQFQDTMQPGTVSYNHIYLTESDVLKIEEVQGEEYQLKLKDLIHRTKTED